ncbi:IclR family transcriptional regulator [Gordonia insulae]|uniref:Pca regulon regulatory protein n=1 Tax=Gordonia insulae TaxID=2420509 RepID=A0A3G8JPZ5_9ACTN|nr:IclR family transcriptional regulator [Gordonia insulae]AZG46220.1 Pca regulon regulatory protein [Gordonia insulae]
MPRVPTGESVTSRAIRVVEAFGVDDTVLTVGEIARRSGLHVATASRLIEELVVAHWLERTETGVRIGVRLWEVASRASPAVGLREAAMPFMHDLHHVIGNDVQLAVREGVEVLFLERLSAPTPVVNYSRIAGRLPLHASSSGLVLLAYADSSVLDEVASRPMRSFTDKTITDPGQLRATLAHVRREGYALCAGHIFPSTTGIAVPIRGGRGEVVAALGLIVPNDDAAFGRIPALKSTARGISRVMSGGAAGLSDPSHDSPLND